MKQTQNQDRTVPFYACEHGIPGGCQKDKAEYTYRAIIKAKADYLAHLTLYGDDIAVKAAMHDLVMFSKRCRGVMSLGYVFEER